MAVEIVASRVLLVEGRDEELFFGALIKHLGLQNIQVIGIAGKTNLRQNLKALTLSPRFPEVISLYVWHTKMWIWKAAKMAGAACPTLKWQDRKTVGRAVPAIKLARLQHNSRSWCTAHIGVVRDADDNPDAAFQSVCDALRSVNLPVPERPLVSAGDSPRVTVMILPAENAPGMLEDLCLKAVERDSVTACVEQYFQCLQQQGSPLPNNLSKARVQVFLASRPEAGKRLGEAAQAGYWPWDEEAFAQVKNFLQQISP